MSDEGVKFRLSRARARRRAADRGSSDDDREEEGREGLLDWENSRRRVNYRPSGRSCARSGVSIRNRVGREKWPAARRHDVQKAARSGNRVASGFRGIFFRAFHVDKKCGTQTFPRCDPRAPRALRPPAVDAMVVVYSFFSFFKKNDVFVGYV